MPKEIFDFTQELSIRELEERYELTAIPCKDGSCDELRCDD